MAKQYEQRDMSGAIFRNKKKNRETHADATGTAMIGGVMYWVNAWTKTPRAGGDRFQSLSFKPMDAADQGPSDDGQDQRPPEESPKQFDDSDIPF